MTKKLFPLFITLLVLAYGNAGAAEKVPLYQVEVLVFTTGALKGWTEEYWPWPEELKATNAQDEASETVNAPLQSIPPVSKPFEMSGAGAALLDDLLARRYPSNAPWWMRQVRTVSPAHRLLQDARKRLSPSKGYRIVAHYSWTQPAIDKSQARPFEIIGSTPYGDTLDGLVRFYKNRYGHIELSLDMERRIPQKIREAFARHEGLEPDELPETWTFHLSETRKVKSNEWHYFDHPLFGALAVIRRVSTEQ